MVGHSVEVSLLLCRTWTVYLLGVQQRRRVQPPGRTALWILLLDVFVLSSWQILDPLRREVLQHRSETDPADQDAVLRPYSERCSSMNLELWLTLVYGYKGPLLPSVCRELQLHC
ncbi:gamma-aminobutyric acid type B receptor subunit 2-like [Echeneis naucrates]|uniref:gamma-aminobutyric acid type B receptor subunit 2-like n=1 Tax=Echeneis naucrates TaxID=173247 RepID=UPI00111372C0|nr:gamma-aminobutyric acid type B receptor subunit 2-like [Echeneis naucrates]